MEKKVVLFSETLPLLLVALVYIVQQYFPYLLLYSSYTGGAFELRELILLNLKLVLECRSQVQTGQYPECQIYAWIYQSGSKSYICLSGSFRVNASDYTRG